jgi:Ras-related protein Rab-1A
VDFKMKKIQVNDRSVKLQLWDTAGQGTNSEHLFRNYIANSYISLERYRTIVASFYRGAHGILLVFDVTDINSFLKVRTWLEEIKKNAPEGTSVVLVGNKNDMDSKRMVDSKEAAAFAQKHNIQYLETSAKEGNGIKEAFETLAKECLNVM